MRNEKNTYPASALTAVECMRIKKSNRNKIKTEPWWDIACLCIYVNVKNKSRRKQNELVSSRADKNLFSKTVF